MAAIIGALVDRPGQFVSSLVESRPAYAPRQRWEMPALLAVLLAAAIVRFWGVGSFSLHKPDEDTTALAAVHILVDGTPRFPSGMFYARAIVQSYLIAGSVKAFGQTEWALRLPSVLAGILVVLLAYFLGRRFLDPAWNMAFVGVVALLPGMIADSQEARMYIFLSASLAAYMILLFRWERTGRTTALVGAVVAMLVAIQFQEIALFSGMLVLFPGLASADTGKLRAGLVAALCVVLGYLAISYWAGSFYPQSPRELPTVSQTGEAPTIGALRFQWLALFPVMLAGTGIALLLVRSVHERVAAIVAGMLLLFGLLCQGLLFYHLAAVLLVAGLVLAHRSGGARGRSALLLLILNGALAALHVLILHRAGISPLRKLLGVMVGQPSVWPYLQVADFSPIAMALTVAAVAADMWQLARGGRMRDDVMFALLGVFVPLFAMGFFGWYIPPRYGEFALLPMLICALAAAQRYVAIRPAGSILHGAVPGAVGAALTATLIVNPLVTAQGINAGSRFPDHRAAARYLKSMHLGPRDIVIAEEVLMQTYYLGHVDYWLTGPRNAANYVVRRDGKLVDKYTYVPVIDSGAQLRELIARRGRGGIYVVGSGENQQDGRLQIRGPELSKLLQCPEFATVYVAPDGQTRVWKIDPPAAAGKSE